MWNSLAGSTRFMWTPAQTIPGKREQQNPMSAPPHGFSIPTKTWPERNHSHPARQHGLSCTLGSYPLPMVLTNSSKIAGLSPMSVRIMHLQDWASSQHSVCLGCRMDFQGRQQSLSGLTDGSQQWNMGPSAPLKQQLKLLAEFSCRRHAGEKGSGKGERPSWFGIYSQFPLIIHCVTEAYSCPRKPAAPSSSSCISQTSVHHFTHKAHLWKPKETLSVQKAFTLGCAEAQLLHASADILGGCQGSMETALRPPNSRRQSTQRQLLTVAHSFQYYVRGQNFTEFNRIPLPPDLCILLIRLINNSLYNIPACNTSPPPPQIEKSDAENLLFWA